MVVLLVFADSEAIRSQADTRDAETLDLLIVELFERFDGVWKPDRQVRVLTKVLMKVLMKVLTKSRQTLVGV